MYGVFQHNLGCLDGWLPFTVAPDVSNQADDYPRLYQSHSLNVQAMCDPDLLFLFVSVAAPGKLNDLRELNHCSDLRAWFNALPNEYYALRDTAYRSLSRRILIFFDTSEMVAAADGIREFYRTFNFYLSQL